MVVVLLLAVLLALLAPAAHAAPADVACAGTRASDCTIQAGTLRDALASGAHLVRLGPGPFAGDLVSAGAVEIAGSEGTVVRGDLALTGATAAVHNLRLEGRLSAGPGDVTLDSDDLGGLDLERADTVARGLTVAGGVTVDGGTTALTSTVVAGEDPFQVSGGGSVTTANGAHAADPDATATARVDPPADPRAPGPPLADAGDPAPLAAFEPFEDAAGVPRIAGARRDIGAYEAQPAAVPVPAASVLANGGAEAGLAGWTGSFATAPYGDPSLPTAATGRALAGGARFFTAAGETTPELAQRIDVSAAAAAVDAGLGRATLSGLLGGYGADPDALSVRAVFKDPENRVLGALDLEPVTPAARGNATALLRREAGGAIPARTRAVDVLLHADRRAGGYTDAYADNLGLVLSVPGVPSPDGPDVKPVPGLKAFSGVSVLTARPRLSRRGNARIRVACASATVGACRGILEVRATLPGRRKAERIARRATFTVRHGRSKRVRVRLLVRHRRRLLVYHRIPAVLRAVARDGQGLQRRTTIPITLRTPAP